MAHLPKWPGRKVMRDAMHDDPLTISWQRRMVADVIYYIMGLIWFLCPKKYINLGCLVGNMDQPVIVTAWHDSIIFLPFMWRAKRNSKLAFMASTHKDGQLVGRYMQNFGMVPILGSQKKDGAKAMIKMLRLFKENYCLTITPDGPKGPRHQIQEGVVFLAQKTQLPILTIRVKYSGLTIKKSWDKIKFPLPFCPIIFEYSLIDPNIDNLHELLQKNLGEY